MNLALYVNPVRGGWSPLAPDQWGGSEETAVRTAEALARRGHAVTVFYDGDAVEQAGVRYQNRSEAKPGFDALLSLKCPEAGHLRLAPVQALWEIEERPFDPDPFQTVAACSEYLRRYIQSAVPRSTEKLRMIPLGFEPRDFPAPPPAREPNLVLHTASPDRGLVTLLDLWPEVLAAKPDTQLLITNGWDLFEKYGGSPLLRRELETRLLSLPGNAVTMRRLSPAEMAAAYCRATVWAYWCEGGEQFCLSAVKAQVAGAIPVVKPWGALHETVWSGLTVATREQFVAGVLRALAGEVAPPTIDSLMCQTWDQLAETWETVLTASASPTTASYIRMVPEAPPFARPAGWQAPGALLQFCGEFFNSVRVPRVWLDPSLGLPSGNVAMARDADAVVIGWSLEDAASSPAETIAGLDLAAGTAVLVIASCGPWRAGLRRRAFSRRDLAELFHALPDVQLGCLALDLLGNGILSARFRHVPGRIGQRDLARVLRGAAPRESLSACFIVRNVGGAFLKTLRSIQPIADEICVLDTGSTDNTLAVVEDFRRESSLEVRVEHGLSPRFCFDCASEHAVGEMAFGHRVAGFETPRNQSIAMARGDFVLWLDGDELMLHPERLTKYLRPGIFRGYGIQQRHHSVDPPEAAKTDLPVRVFRREPEGRAPGFVDVNGWPTFDPGNRIRFAGIVHEHPGAHPDFAEGLGPCILLSDVWISHNGYLTEEVRRQRFVRNWPLMVADRQKYPERRLGLFLWLRDLTHQMRYADETGRPQDAMQYAEEGHRIFLLHFVEKAETYASDALMYGMACAARLGKGFQFEVTARFWKPEATGDEKLEVALAGRLESAEQVLHALKARIGDVSRWAAPYV